MRSSRHRDSKYMEEAVQLYLDVTRMKEALISYMEQEESEQISYVVVDRDGIVQDVSPSARRILKTCACSMVGKCLWGEIPELLGGALYRNVRRSFKKCKPYYSSLTLIKDSLYDIYVYSNEQHATIYFSPIAQETLERLSGFVNRIVDTALNPMIVFDGSGIILRSNELADELLLGSEGELVGESLFAFTSCESIKVVEKEVIESVIRRRTSPLQDCILILPNGRSLQAETTTSPCVYQGKLAAVMTLEPVRVPF